MNKINPKSLQDLGILLRKRSFQLHQNVARIHNSELRPKSRSVGNLRSALKTRKESKVFKLTRKQETLANDFSKALFLKTQFPFVNNSADPDDFSSKDFLDFEPVLNPLETNEVPLNSEIPDINYAEERPNRKELARSLAHSQSPLQQSAKLLSKFSDVKVNQNRSASTFEQNDAGSATGNKQHDQSKYKANKKQFASAYQNIELSRSGRRKIAQLQDIATSSKVSSLKGPKQGPTKQTYKKLDSLSRSEQKGTMPSIFSIQLHHVTPPPAEKRFIFRRQYSKLSCHAPAKYPTTKQTVKSSEPIKPPECIEYNKGLYKNPIPRFYYVRKEKNKPNLKEICMGDTSSPTDGRKTCTRNYSSKVGGKDKDKSKDDHCKKPQHKTCPHMKPRGSCHENLAENPCTDQKKTTCDNKPTRQDCETD